MTPDEALARVEQILGIRPQGGTTRRHYRVVRTPNGKSLGVDVIRLRGCQGHVRVHLWNVTDAEVQPHWVTTAPSIKLSRHDNCPKCKEIDPNRTNPSLHVQSENDARLYYGFEWHTQDEPTDEDLRDVERAVAWLKALPFKVDRSLKEVEGEIEAPRWGEVWLASLEAFCRATESGDPVQAFGPLLHRYPNDPMVYFERAEAFEYCGHPRDAEVDCRRSEAFPMPAWKFIARYALRRAQGGRVDPRDTREYFADAMHRLHAFPELGPERLMKAIHGVEEAANHPELARAAFRWQLESIVDHLENRRGRPNKIELVFRLKALRDAGKLDLSTWRIADKLRDQGNALHYGSAPTCEIRHTIDLFLDLLKELKDNRSLYC